MPQPLRFQGQYFDAESGLHYNRYRYYSPETARFITPDPIGLTGGLNQTQYVPNPTGWVDPLGLTSVKRGCPPDSDIPAGVSRRSLRSHVVPTLHLKLFTQL
ncbi:TPA: RHS repeat-associated core domain-containing protein [Serratia fonticola]